MSNMKCSASSECTKLIASVSALAFLASLLQASAHSIIPVLRPTEYGSLITDHVTTFQLAWGQGASFNDKQWFYPIDAGSYETSPYFGNSGCGYIQFNSTSAVTVFVTSRSNLGKIRYSTGPGTYKLNVSQAVPVLSSSFNKSLTGASTFTLHTTEEYALVIVNTGSDSANVTWALSAYNRGDPVCTQASQPDQSGGANAALAESLRSKNVAPYIEVFEQLALSNYSFLAYVQDASCIALQVQPTASYQRVDNAVIDLTYVVQSRSMTDAWVKDSQQTFKFPIPFIQQPIYQITPSVVIQGSSSITGSPNQTIQATFNDLDAGTEYILFAYNGQESPNATTATATVRVAGRSTGNCSDVQWPPPIADSPSSTSGSPANAENAGHSNHVKAIVGGLCGGLGALVLVASLAIYYMHRKNIMNRHRFEREDFEKAFSVQTGDLIASRSEDLGVLGDWKEMSFSTGDSTWHEIQELRTMKTAEVAVLPEKRLYSVAQMNPQDQIGIQTVGNCPTLRFKKDVPNLPLEGLQMRADNNPGDLQNLWKVPVSSLQIKVRDGKCVKLGSGGYGCVFLGLMNGTTMVALKNVHKPTDKELQKFTKEILLMKAVHHPNIVQFLGACMQSDQDKEMLLIMEYMPLGDLWHMIRSDSYGKLRWNRMGRRIAKDIARGLNYLHQNGIIHMDMKSPNVLLSSSAAKIGDVGLGCTTKDVEEGMLDGASYLWAAPEQLSNQRCTTATDIFALGVVLWELVTGENPPRDRLLRNIQVPEEAPQSVADIIFQCTALDLEERPTAAEVFEVINQR